jgi:hypothetical protein
MTPNRAFRVLSLALLIAFASIASAATIEFRVLFDVDHDETTGCTVSGMAGIEQVLTTELIETAGPDVQVARTFRQVCTGVVLSAATDVDATGWAAGWSETQKELNFETRIPFGAFGPAGMPRDVRAGFEIKHLPAVQTAFVDGNGDDIIVPAPPVRRRSITFDRTRARRITMDDSLDDWQLIPSSVYGIASDGTQALRLLRVFTFANPDPADPYLYFAAIARLGSNDPYADDDFYVRAEGQPLVVGGPGVLSNDGDPFGQPLTAEQLSDPGNGVVTLNTDGGFTYTPNNEASKADDTFEYRAKAGPRSSNVARVQIRVGEPTENDAPQINDATFSIPEFSPVGTVVGTVPVTDDPGDTHTYQFTGGNINDAFEISNTGVITVKKPSFLDADVRPVWTLTVRVTDDAVPPASDTATVTINLIAGNDAPSFTSAPSAVVPENTTSVMTVTASDPEGDALTFSIVGGPDASRFAIGSTTGALSFVAAPDFEAPGDSGANNVYNVTVQVSDGGNLVSQAITVTVTDVNETPEFTSNASPNVPENTTAVVTVSASDPEGTAVTYSITGGSDAALFSINASTGALTFLAAPNFESPSDAGANNIYNVAVTATDGVNANQQFLTVTVTNVNEPPVFTSNAAPSIPENTTAVVTVTVTDPEAAAITFSITGGADAALFTINPTTGALSFSAAPNFEAPADAGANNVYDLVVTASDGTNNPTQNIAVTVTNVDEPPAITSGNATSYAENGVGTVLTVTAFDPESHPITFAITGGADSGDLAINPTTGAVTFNASPNFEAPVDSDTNNTYIIQVTATSSGGTDVQTITVTVTDVAEQPAITSGNTFSVPEGVTPVTTVTATDPDGTSPTFSIVGGADAADFTINPTTGALSFVVAPNFEAPADADTNNQYLVTVRASDGTLFDDDALTVTVLDVNEAPVFTTGTTANVAENTTAVMTVNAVDPEATAITYSITGGADSSLFTINPTTGALSFNSAPNFEAPADAGTNNVYDVIVTASDGTNNPTQNIAITVTDVNEAPVANDATFGVDENTANGTAVGTVVATDVDAGQTLTYAITAGNALGAFAINSSNGQITVADVTDLNFEVNTTFNLTVTVTDNGTGTLSDTAAITINVNNVNEAPVVNDATVALNENSANGTSVHTVTFTEPDTTGQTHTFAITAGNTGGAFAINPSTGEITVANSGAVNFEATPSFSLTIQVNDSGSPFPNLGGTGTITINLNNVNDPPVVADQSFNVDENSANGVGVGTVVATDDEVPATQTLTYSITGGNALGAFAINPSTGAITVADTTDLDFETNPTFSLTVQVQDNGAGNLTDTATVTINLNDVNEAPVIAAAGPFNVNENSPNGTSIATITATDVDASQTLTWSITGGNTGSAFTINPSTGEITIATSSAVDFETNPTFTLTVQASDNGTPVLSDTESVTINVNNVNETPVVNAATFAIDENSANGTSVGTVTFTEPDTGSGQTHTFAINGGNTGGAFAINASTGEITVANSAAVDFETNPTFSLTVEVTDAGAPTPNLTGSNTITINLNNANEAPVVNDQSFNVDENVSIGTVVGSVAFSDPDGPGQTWSITAGNGGGEFALNPTTGQITTAAALNYESTTSYVFTVQLSDGGSPLGTDTAQVTININDLNEAPVVNAAGPFTLAENSPNGTSVGTPITFTEPDAGQTHTYSIFSGNTGGAFAIDSGGQITVANLTAVNYEANPTFSLVIHVTDNGTPALFGSTTVVVNLTDVNDTPVVNDQIFAIAETASVGAVVGTVVATDDEVPATQTLTYSITAGNTGGAFAINASTGQITVANTLDYETLSSYALTVQVQDNGAGNLTDTATVTVNVQNVNEAPVANDATFAVDENSSNGTVVGTVTASDPDLDTLTYVITSGNTGGAFAINSGNGQITVANPIDFEALAAYSLVVTVTDNGSPNLNDTATITINVNNVNEAPVVNAAGPFTIQENLANATTVGTPITFTEPDTTGQTHTYSITGGNTGGAFAIDNSGQITVANSAAVNYEATPSFTLTVTVTDSGLPNPPNQQGSTSVTINLTDVNDAPVYGDAARSVAENSANSTNVGAPVTATDEDVPAQTLTYSITGGNTGNVFAINSSTGQITVNGAIDFEGPDDPYSLTVQVQDNGTGNLTDTATVTITVTDVNEAPTANDATFAVNENSPNSTVVGTVVATDPDGTAPNNTLSYAITAGNTLGAFAINSSNGQITVADVTDINFEVNPTFNLTVTVTDGGAGPLSDTAAITINITDLNEAPTAVDDSYNAVGGTLMHITGAVILPVPAPVASTGDVAPTPRTTGVKANDTDPDTNPSFNTLTVTFVTGNAGAVAVPLGGQASTTTADGSVTMHSDGSFYFIPNAGFTGSNTFDYTINDALNNDTGTVTITVHAPAIRYVKNDAPSAGNGTSATPHQTLAAAITASTAGELIYVLRGDGTATNYGGSNAMKANQSLWGQGVALSVTANTVALNLIAATSHSLIGPGTAANATVSVPNVSGVDIQGLSITGGLGNAIDLTTTGATAGGFSASNNIITAATLEGIEVNHGSSAAVTVTVQSNAITSTGNGFDYARTGTGTGVIVFSTNAVTSGATGVSIAGGAAASSTITGFASNTISGNTVGAGVTISNVTFDSVPGGGINQVDGDNFLVGASGNPVGGAGVAITTSQGDLFFDDLDVFAAVGTALQLSGTGSGLTFSVLPTTSGGSSTLDADDGAALDVNTVAIDLRLSDLDTATTVSGVALNAASGQLTVPAAGSISKTSGAGTAFSVASSSATVNYAGTINVTSGAGVALTTNTGAINFTGVLTLSTGANNAFAASGASGTITSTATASTIKTTSGTALRIDGPDIGAAGMTFQCISAGRGDVGGTGCTQGASSGTPANGIFLNGTGATGVLTVNGGASTALGGDGSGGTIFNATGATGTNSGIGVYVNGGRAILRRMRIDDASNYGIFGTGAMTFTLEYSTVDSTAAGTIGDSAGADDEEGSIAFEEWAGSGAITSCVIGDGFSNNLRVLNTNGADLNRLTITNSTFNNNGAAGNNNLHFESRNSGSTLNWTLDGSVIKGARADWVNASNNSSSLMDAIVTNNDFSNLGLNAHATAAAGGNRLVFGSVGTLTYDILGNDFEGSKGEAIRIRSTAGGGVSGAATGTIDNNDIGLPGTANSGSSEAMGIFLFTDGGGDQTALVNNNRVHQYNNHGIRVDVGDQAAGPGTSNVQVTITNNTVSNPGNINTDFNGIHLNHGTVAADNFTSCIDIRLNSILASGSGAVAPNNADFRLRQRQATTVRLPGYGGANNNDAAVVTFITNQQTAPLPGSGGASNTVPTGGGFIGGAACAQP